MTITLRSPAKVNLFLKIIGKRRDGYHELASLFQAIDLYDQIEIKKAGKDLLHCNDERIPTDRSNMVFRALDLFREKTGIDQSIEIDLKKRIPSEAGLGGGSGNAATTLWGLNVLFGTEISTERLQRWSAEIGSDVPFFFSEGTAYCTGRGERVVPCPSLLLREISLYWPNIGLSTPDVYRCFQLDQVPIRNPEQTLRGWMEGKFECYNDLEPSAFGQLSTLQKIKEELQEKTALPVLMSGSGTSIFSFEQIDSPYFIGNVQGCRREVDGWYGENV